MAKHPDIRYKMGAFTAGTKDFADRIALRNALHPDSTIGDATKLAARLGYDLVLTHAPMPDDERPVEGDGRIPAILVSHEVVKL